MNRLALLALALVPASLAGQSVDERLAAASRIPPETAALARELAASAVQRGLPADPIIQKAIEGSAKAVPADRVALALRGVMAQLEASAAALRGAGVHPPDTVVVAAGAFAINAGLSDEHVARLAAARAEGTAVTLRVAGTLAAIGVPAAEVVELVTAALSAGQSPGDLLALPGAVQAAVARGATPAQAAAGLARAAAASQRRGPPPVRPTPPPKQPKP
jgi:hypothetical protein